MEHEDAQRKAGPRFLTISFPTKHQIPDQFHLVLAQARIVLGGANFAPEQSCYESFEAHEMPRAKSDQHPGPLAIAQQAFGGAAWRLWLLPLRPHPSTDIPGMPKKCQRKPLLQPKASSELKKTQPENSCHPLCLITSEFVEHKSCYAPPVFEHKSCYAPPVSSSSRGKSDKLPC